MRFCVIVVFERKGLVRNTDGNLADVDRLSMQLGRL